MVINFFIILFLFVAIFLTIFSIKPIEMIRWIQQSLLKLKGFKLKDFNSNVGNTNYFEKGKGTKIALIHGFMVHSGNWLSIAPQLSKNHQVYMPHLPGHGGVPKVEPNTLERVNEVLTAFLLSISENKPITLIGSSMGGGIAFRFALDYPERVDKLVVINGAGIDWELDRRLLLPESRADVLRKMRAIVNPKMNIPNFVLDGLLKQNQPIYRELFDDAVGNSKYYLDEELPTLQMKVYILWGEQDLLFNMDFCRKMCSLIPNHELKIFPKSAHVPHNTEPKAVLDYLKGVL
jgi:pimeloyl-ACP methyl ester carboxylesterase